MIEVLVSPFGEAFMLRALAEVTLIGITAGVLGCWVVLYGLSYAGESISHSIFPGLVLAALIGAPLLIGGAPAVALAALAIALIARLPQLGRDTAVAIAVTGMFGLGGVLAAGSSASPALADILFGDVLGTTNRDLVAATVLAAIVLAVAFTFHDRILAFGFDPGASRSLGFGPTSVELIVLLLLAGTVLVAVQGLGNLLVVAILIAPAATARLLTKRLVPMMSASAGLAVAIGVAGLYTSYYLGTAAGASIAAIAVLTYVVASIVTPRRGLNALETA